MVTYEEALAQAKAYYQKSGEVVVKAWDHPDYWIFYGDAGDGRTKFGGQPISVSKTNGSLELLFIPSKEGFALFNVAEPIALG